MYEIIDKFSTLRS